MNQEWSPTHSLPASTPNDPTIQSPEGGSVHSFNHRGGSVIAHTPSGDGFPTQTNHSVVNHHPSVVVTNSQQNQNHHYPNHHQQHQIAAYQPPTAPVVVSAESSNNVNTSFSSLSTGSAASANYDAYYRSQSGALQSPQDGSIFFPGAGSFNPYSNLGSPATWPYSAFPYNELDQYHHYNQSGSLTDLLNPIQHFDMPSGRTGMVIQNPYGGGYAMASKKRTGGRRPKEEEDQVLGLSAEEREKRQLRRVRNKEAAARCRQRRLNHMQALQAQVDALAAENREKQHEIDNLQQEKDELFQILQSHQCHMKQNGGTKPAFLAPIRGRHSQVKAQTPPVKVEPLDPTLTQVVTISGDTEGFNTLTSTGLSRPSSLPFDTPNTPGVPIQTPTAGFGGFDLLGQSTGLTPVTNTGLTPILTLGGLVTSNNLTLETPTGMDVSAPGGQPTLRVSTTLHNL